MGLETKLNSRRARALEKMLVTLDRLDLMDRYLVTIEMRPGASLDRYSDIIYDKPQKVYGLTIRIMDERGVVKRIVVDDEEE